MQLICVRRTLKKGLLSLTNIRKDTPTDFLRASGIFVIYMMACAIDFARENWRQIITANDILAAIKVRQQGIIIHWSGTNMTSTNNNPTCLAFRFLPHIGIGITLMRLHQSLTNFWNDAGSQKSLKRKPRQRPNLGIIPGVRKVQKGSQVKGQSFRRGWRWWRTKGCHPTIRKVQTRTCIWKDSQYITSDYRLVGNFMKRMFLLPDLRCCRNWLGGESS
jgi:hypothetical protein